MTKALGNWLATEYGVAQGSAVVSLRTKVRQFLSFYSLPLPINK